MIRRLWPWLRVLIGVGILAALVSRLGAAAFLDGLRVINAWSVLAALGIGLLTTVFSAWRWRVVACGLGLRLSLPVAVADYYRAALLNSVLPAGMLGDVHRAVNHGQRSGDLARGIRAVVLERFAGQAVLIVVGVAVLLTQPALVSAVSHDLAPSQATVIVGLGVLAAVIALAAWTRWGRSGGRWRRGIATAVADARLGLLSRDVRLPVVLLSVAALAGHLALFLVAARVAGSQAPLTQLLPLLLLALLAMGLPINIGGWGPREVVCALVFSAAGLGAMQGLTAAVVYGVLALAASLPGLAVLAFRRNTRKRPSGHATPSLGETAVP